MGFVFIQTLFIKQCENHTGESLKKRGLRIINPEEIPETSWLQKIAQSTHTITLNPFVSIHQLYLRVSKESRPFLNPHMVVYILPGCEEGESNEILRAHYSSVKER